MGSVEARRRGLERPHTDFVVPFKWRGESAFRMDSGRPIRLPGAEVVQGEAEPEAFELPQDGHGALTVVDEDAFGDLQD